MKFMTFRRFAIIFRNIRIFPPFEVIENGPERMIWRVSGWSNLIQDISTRLFTPGLSIAVDECMIRFTGRSKAKVTIPRKPIPIGLKVWVAAQQGYFLRWRFHIPTASRPRGISMRRRQQKQELAETQAVVLDLVLKLPTASYHVFFENLFTTPQLLQALRKQGIAATGTARVNSGIYPPFVVAKTADNTGKLDWPFNRLRAVPTVDDIVNQIAWKDNALVLFMTSYFSGSERQDHVRRRPTSSHPRARPAMAFFGDEPQRSVSTPCIAVAYNHEMNAVDRGDQLRSYIGYNHAIRRGGWQALAWTFLLETALINTYILQKRGSCNWKPYENQEQWREAICSQLIAKYYHDGVTRKYLRAGDEFTQVSQHNHVKTENIHPAGPAEAIKWECPHRGARGGQLWASLKLTDHASAAGDRMLNTWRNRPSSRPVKQSQASGAGKETSWKEEWGSFGWSGGIAEKRRQLSVATGPMRSVLPGVINTDTDTEPVQGGLSRALIL
ncbi:hypothetical protein MRS44_013860 [Fusarium solani]|uniref:uncharacterized protein n=1 Tax=Fusarium solani TaxID=169388 RepID=UPI0032C46BEC|nr:hypothetical protein MRS44_013860 [Fusarium solani]